MSVFGMTVNPQRTPVNPPVLEKLRNSTAHSSAPGISKIECGICRIADVALVGGVEKEERLMLLRVCDPARQLRARRHRAGRIVRETKINKVGMFVRRLRRRNCFPPCRADR